MKVSRQAKAIVGTAVFAVGEALTYGVLPERWRPYAQAVIGVGLYTGIYRPRNAPPVEPPPPAEGSASAGNTVYKR